MDREPYVKPEAAVVDIGNLITETNALGDATHKRLLRLQGAAEQLLDSLEDLEATLAEVANDVDRLVGLRDKLQFATQPETREEAE